MNSKSRRLFVDTTIYAMLCKLAGRYDLPWNDDVMQIILDTAREFICETTNMDRQEFYPVEKVEDFE